jgi:hypothetical protein
MGCIPAGKVYAVSNGRRMKAVVLSGCVLMVEEVLVPVRLMLDHMLDGEVAWVDVASSLVALALPRASKGFASPS